MLMTYAKYNFYRRQKSALGLSSNHGHGLGATIQIAPPRWSNVTHFLSRLFAPT